MNTGIYKITNLVDGKFYIGSARKSFESRFKVHRSTLKNNKHRNKHLQRAYNIHGLNHFKFEIIEVCSENILDREQYYIDLLNPEYNFSRNVRQPNLGQQQSEETRVKMSKARMGVEPWNKGLKYSDELKTKFSEAQKGKSYPTRNGLLGISERAVERSDGKIFRNVYEASVELNVQQNTIVKAITDKKIKRKVKGYTFKYIHEPKGIK